MKKRIRLTVQSLTLSQIQEWADADGLTLGEVVDRAMSLYHLHRNEVLAEEEKGDLQP